MKKEQFLHLEDIPIIQKVVQDKGILFEEEIEQRLHKVFNKKYWDVSSNEGFDERYEIDFIARPISPFSFLAKTPLDPLNFYSYKANPYLLIEAKTSSYEWFFFKNGEVKDNDLFYNFVDFESENKEKISCFCTEEKRSLKVKRSVQIHIDSKGKVVKKGEKAQCPENDLARLAVRQITKNTQEYLKKLESDTLDKMVIPIIITNTKLNAMDYADIKNENCKYTEYPYVFFEMDDFMFWKGKKIATKNNENNRENFVAHFHVWIVNEKYLEGFLQSILDQRILNAGKLI